MADDKKGTEGGGKEDLARIKEEFASEMGGLRKRQRAAVEKALKAVDRKKIEKIRKSLDDIVK